MRAISIVVAALVVAAPAAADIGIVGVAPSAARPGQTVRVHVNGYLPMRLRAMPIVLVRADLMPRPYPCKKAAICEPIVWRGRLERPPYRILGFTRGWRRNRTQPDHADARFRVRVPRVAPGRYTLALWCAPCVRGPQGSLIAGPRLTIR